jgi:signal transduction histidine kinase
VSHEIGTPLSRMRFQVGMLEDEIQRPNQRNRLRALSDDLDELDELSTELVAWMEPDSTASTLTRDFELQPVLESLAELARSGKARPQPITVVVPANVTLCADQRQFQRALENLLRNALRYAHESVVVEVQVDTAGVVIEVRDDGPGIPREQWTHVFEPFVRIDAPRSRAHRGLGLGLAIVRRIVEAHGGMVTVTDASEGGTCVRTFWPARRSPVGVWSSRRPAPAVERST